MRRTVVLVVCLLVAGCFGGDRNDDAVEPSQRSSTSGQEPAAVVGGGAPSLSADSAGTRTFWFNGTYDLAVAGVVELDDHQYAFPVGSNATGVVVELVWTSAGSVADLDAVVRSPWHAEQPTEVQVGALAKMPTPGWHQNYNGFVGSPDVPSIVRIDQKTIAAETCPGSVCAWVVLAYHDPVAYEVPYRFTVTVEYP